MSTEDIESLREHLYLDLMETLFRLSKTRGEDFDFMALPEEIHLPEKGMSLSGKKFSWLKHKGSKTLEGSTWFATAYNSELQDTKHYYLFFKNNEIGVAPAHYVLDTEFVESIQDSLSALRDACSPQITEVKNELAELDKRRLELTNRLAELRAA